MRRLMMVLVIAAAAAGCNRAGEEAGEAKDGAAGVNDGAAAAGAPAIAPGLWAQTMTIEMGGATVPPQSIKICQGDDSDAMAGAMGGDINPDACTENTMARRPDGVWAIHRVCDMGSGGTMTMDAELSGDTNTEYSMKMTMGRSGAAVPQMNQAVTATIAAKREGDCPAGMNPGAIERGGLIIDPSGMK